MDMKETPCIVFVIPFAPRKVKAKWDIACAQLRQTLVSIQNSTCENYRVVVAGHDAPDFEIASDSRFCFLRAIIPCLTIPGAASA
jgi:hypothetical protein